jgi:putative hydroxymethylpyrimidine transport system substrate-binding protein
MIKKLLLGLCLSCAIASPAMAANEKMKLLLDWFVNPDHAPMVVAKQIGAFDEVGLDVEIIPPADPNVQPRLAAAKQVDLAVYYQSRMPLLATEGIPVVRVGALIDRPLTSMIAIKGRKIATLADLKGKNIGYSVSGINEAIVNTMLKTVGLSVKDVTLTGVNFQLSTALLSGRVDAIIGLRTFQSAELKGEKVEPLVFGVEDYGVPAFDQFIFITNRDNVGDPKIKKFMQAIKKATAYLKAHPEETWEKFIVSYPDMNNALNKDVWMQTVGYFPDDPTVLNKDKYEAFNKFLTDAGELAKPTKVSDYAVELK